MVKEELLYKIRGLGITGRTFFNNYNHFFVNVDLKDDLEIKLLSIIFIIWKNSLLKFKNLDSSIRLKLQQLWLSHSNIILAHAELKTDQSAFILKYITLEQLKKIIALEPINPDEFKTYVRNYIYEAISHSYTHVSAHIIPVTIMNQIKIYAKQAWNDAVADNITKKIREVLIYRLAFKRKLLSESYEDIISGIPLSPVEAAMQYVVGGISEIVLNEPPLPPIHQYLENLFLPLALEPIREKPYSTLMQIERQSSEKEQKERAIEFEAEQKKLLQLKKNISILKEENAKSKARANEIKMLESFSATSIDTLKKYLPITYQKVQENVNRVISNDTESFDTKKLKLKHLHNTVCVLRELIIRIVNLESTYKNKKKKEPSLVKKKILSHLAICFAETQYEFLRKRSSIHDIIFTLWTHLERCNHELRKLYFSQSSFSVLMETTLLKEPEIVKFMQNLILKNPTLLVDIPFSLDSNYLKNPNTIFPSVYVSHENSPEATTQKDSIDQHSLNANSSLNSEKISISHRTGL